MKKTVNKKVCLLSEQTNSTNKQIKFSLDILPLFLLILLTLVCFGDSKRSRRLAASFRKRTRQTSGHEQFEDIVHNNINTTSSCHTEDERVSHKTKQAKHKLSDRSKHTNTHTPPPLCVLTHIPVAIMPLPLLRLLTLEVSIFSVAALQLPSSSLGNFHAAFLESGKCCSVARFLRFSLLMFFFSCGDWASRVVEDYVSCV